MHVPILPSRPLKLILLAALLFCQLDVLADESCVTKKDPDPLGTCTIGVATATHSIRICLGSHHPRCFELNEAAGSKKIYSLSQIVSGVRGSTKMISDSEFKLLNQSLNDFAKWAKEKERRPELTLADCSGAIVIESLGSIASKQEFCREWLPKSETQKKVSSLIERLESAGAKSSKL
jgi:hypothetical protein